MRRERQTDELYALPSNIQNCRWLQSGIELLKSVDEKINLAAKRAGSRSNWWMASILRDKVEAREKRPRDAKT